MTPHNGRLWRAGFIACVVLTALSVAVLVLYPTALSGAALGACLVAAWAMWIVRRYV